VPPDPTKEFAPGLPEKGRTRGLPQVGGRQTWELAVQDHEANRAGRHFDLRLGDPSTGVAHSWALPKAKLPGPGDKPVLAVQQGDHTLEYMDFKGKIPSGYGAGTVKRHLRDKAEVFHADADKIKFNHYSGQGHDEYVLRRTDDKKWLLLNTTQHVGRTPVLPKPKYKEEKKEQRLNPGDESRVWAPKVDGAHNVFFLEKGKPIRAFSHRPSKSRRSGLLEHSHKVPGLMDKKVPDSLHGTIVRGEVFSRGEDGRPAAAETVGGMLNSSVWKSRDKQKEHGKLEIVTFDVVKHRGKDLSAAPYAEKLKALREVEKEFPQLRTTEVARTKEEKLRMLQAIREGKHPLTTEGVVEWNLHEGTRPMKHKFKPDSDLKIVGTFATKGGKYKGTHVGGILVEDENGVVSRVGTGFTDDFRRLAYERPDLIKGRTAKIVSMGKFPSGKLRTPSFTGLHMEKNDPSDIKRIEDETGVTLSQMSRAKLAELTVLTGGMGAGKSTWAKKNKDRFDLVLGTDTGSPDGKGGYTSPSKEERDRIRKDKDERAVAAHREGKRVLLEGFPKGVLQHPRSLAAANHRLVLGTGPATRLFRVAKRSKQRGTSTLKDLSYAMGTFKEDRANYRKIKEYGPLTKVSFFAGLRRRMVAGREQAEEQERQKYTGARMRAGKHPKPTVHLHKKLASLLLRGKTAALLAPNTPTVVSKTKQKHIDSWEKRKGKLDLPSTNLGTVAYNSGRRALTVEFAKGGLYRYSDVPPETYAAMLKAKSHGKHFHKNVKVPGLKYRRLV